MGPRVDGERVFARRRDAGIARVGHDLTRPDLGAHAEQRAAGHGQPFNFGIVRVANGFAHGGRVDDGIGDRARVFRR